MKPQLYKNYKDIPPHCWPWGSFSPKEIACKGDGEIMIDPESLNKLQTFRDILGIPFTPNSAYRSVEYNKKIGGAPNSMHLYGKAFDIPIKKGMSRDQIKHAAQKAGFTGFGDYDTFVHIDTGKKRYWNLQTKGDKK